MEFVYGAWLGTSTAKGQDGRPLGEDNASPGFYREQVPTKYHVSNFGDSRDGKLYNITALHDMMKSWTEVMELYDHFRTFYIKEFQLNRDKLTTIDLFVLSKLVVASTAYLLRSNEYEYHDGNIPGVLTAQNKLITGVFMIMRKMIERGDKDLNDTKPAESDRLYEYSDEHHVLISPRDANFACGGSVRKIKELLEISISGWNKKGLDEDRAHENQALFKDYSKAFEYGKLDLQMELVLQFAQAEILTSVLKDNGHVLTCPSEKEEILNYARTQLPCEYFNVETLAKQKVHLQEILLKLGSEAILPENHSLSCENFPEAYTNYVENLRLFSSSQQNKINQLLHIEEVSEFSPEKMNKRLAIIPKKVFNSF